MTKKQKSMPRHKLTQLERERLQRKKSRKRILIIALASFLCIAAAVGVTIYQLNSRNTSTAVSSGYTVSGTVSYTGTQTSGRVYIGILDSNKNDTGLGTSIASPGSFAIHDVPNGTYTLNAWMDNSNPQIAISNALSPIGTASVTVNNANIPGQNITVTDPSTASNLVPPTNVIVAAGNESALVEWTAPLDTNGKTLAQYYNVYYGTSSSVSPATGIKMNVQANSNVFVSGLTDGTTYYFVVTAVLGGVESPASAPAVSATIATTTGSNTISGAISFPGTATGPLYIGLSGHNGTFFQRVDKPISPQPYTISGVPTGTYVIFTILDMNDNGVIDTGDLNRIDNDPKHSTVTIDVGSDIKGMNQTLLASNVLARVVTLHLGSTLSLNKDIYNLEFEIRGNLKLPVKITLVSGSNGSFPVDMGGNQDYYHLLQTAKVKPNMGDSYVFMVTYSDGTSEKVSVPVTASLDSFPQNLTTSGANRNIPTFNWAAPAKPPSDYTYLIQVGQSNTGQEWTYPQNGSGMPASQTSVLFNVDGNASLTSLQSGTPYDWLICLIDSNGNQAIYSTTYTP